MRHFWVWPALLLVGFFSCKKLGEKRHAMRIASKPAFVPGEPDGPPDRNRAEALHAQGVAAYKQKDFAVAAEKLRAAISADLHFVPPHYQLACVAALLNDKSTARAELEWLAKSADPNAHAVLKKAKDDADLRSLFSDPQSQKILQWSGIFAHYRPLILDEPASSGSEQRLSLRGEFAQDHEGIESILVSLAGGATLFDEKNRVIARSEPLDEKATELIHLSVGQVAPDDALELVIHTASSQRRDARREFLTVLKRRDNKFISILSATVGSDANDLSLEANGTILVREEGQPQPKVMQWDADKFAFINVPSTNADTP